MSTSKQSQEEKFESVYQHKLECLVCGFCNNHQIPIVILKLIETKHTGKNKPILRIEQINNISRKHSQYIINFECFLDNVTKHSNKILAVNKYKLNWIKCDILKPHIIQTVDESKIFEDTFCIKFYSIKIMGWSEDSLYKAELSALNSQNQVVLKLIKTFTINIHLNRTYLHPWYYKNKNLKQFHLIKVNKNGDIDVPAWIKTMNQLLNNTKYHANELLFTRIFYYIYCFLTQDYQQIFKKRAVDETSITRFILEKNRLTIKHDYYKILEILEKKLEFHF